MSYDDRLGLHDRLETQALLGEPALLVDERAGWAKVELLWQPSHKGSHGYPGWVLYDHLAPAVLSSRPLGTITSRLARARTKAGGEIALSYGTVLPVKEGYSLLARTSPGPAERVRGHLSSEPVWLIDPSGDLLEVAAKALAPAGEAVGGALTPAGQAPPRALAPVVATGPELIRSAREFLGTAYLWGGCSGYGVDCSGLTHLVHRSAGLRIPRDADDQFAGAKSAGETGPSPASGQPVALSELAPGDLLFFAKQTKQPHHVGFCAGVSRLLHSPGTGLGVEEIDLVGSHYAQELLPAGRRYTTAHVTS